MYRIIFNYKSLKYYLITNKIKELYENEYMKYCNFLPIYAYIYTKI
jgi:hypothetical protein